MRDNYEPFEATGKRGSLYYVRLNTQLGKFYKIGFTTLKSVNDRLAFQGTGDEKYIDEVLYFEAHQNALELEDCLHTYFSEKAAFAKFSAYVDMPLPRNGQTELYYDDVLGLDNKFTPAQAESTRKSVELAIAKRTYPSEDWTRRMIFANKAIVAVLMIVANIIGWSFKFVQRILGVKPYKPILPPSILERHEKAQRFLVALGREQDAKRVRKHREFRVILLIYAFSNRNILDFKKVVSLEELGQDIANSLIMDFVMFSDYLCIPNNCCMFSLMEHMNHSNCHELLTRPAKDSYIPMIEEYVSTRKITDTSIRIPDDPIYVVAPEDRGCEIAYTDYFGAQEFIGLLECKFISRGPFIHDDSKQTVEFVVKLEDELTAKKFDLRIVVNASNKKLRLSFPNLSEVIREYQGQLERKHQMTN